MTKTSFLHFGVSCRDPKKFEEFYIKYFGFRRVKEILIEKNKKIVFLKDGNNFCFEIFPADEKPPVPMAEADGPRYPGWRHVAFMVDDVDAKLADMGENAVITHGPVALDNFTKGWKAVWIKDPEGNIIEICQGYKDK